MNKNSLIVFLVGLLLISTNNVDSQTAKQIIERMESQMRGNTLYAEMSMTTVRPRFTREIQMKTWSKGEDYSVILITAPARDKGTVYLKRGKEIWNYVPNIDRMVKMPPSMMSQSWMGSDFSNDDLVRESSSINDFEQKIVGNVNYQGFDCWILELTPKPNSSIVYGKVKVWVSKNDYLQLKTENYDESGKLANSVLFSEVKQMGGRKIPTVIEMVPEDKKGHKTILKYLDVRFDAHIDDNFFSVQNVKNLK